MASSKKFANLPDVDAAPEIYETPELTDDASTVQTGTIRSGGSPTPLDEEIHNFSAGVDRQKLDSEKARRRFEPATVNAREADFSDTISGDRQDYIAGYRRRRRRGIENGALHDDSEDDLEAPAEKLARLKREAEELRSELSAQNDGESAGHQESEIHNGMSDLDHILESIRIEADPSSQKLARAARIQQPSGGAPRSSPGLHAEKETQSTDSDQPSPATMQAIASFADRITALEAMIGLPSQIPSGSQQNEPLLPSLFTLSNQLSTLSASLLPPQTQSTTTSATNHTMNPPAPISSLPNLDVLKDRITSLTNESKRLTESRKRAKEALSDLQESRLRHQRTSSRHRAHPSHNRQTSSISQTGPTPAGAGGFPQSTTTPAADVDPDTIVINTQHTQLFLEDQASKITALYQMLPTIQDLAPTLPLVLDRLKSLSVIHGGAGEAKALMDGLEQGLLEREKEIERWRVALEGVEKGVGEMGKVMEGNGKVVEGLVKGLEERVLKLEERSKVGK